MKAFLTRASDRDKAREVLKAAMAGDLDTVRALVDAGAECGMDRADVDDLALLLDGANTHMFGMLNLHEAGKALNAPLYFAAFRRDEILLNYFLNQTSFCQDSLNAALYGAAAAGAQYIVTRLLDLGADAACADGACVEVAVAKGYDGIAKALLDAGKSYTAALAAYIDRGNTAQVIDLLAEGAEPRHALKAVCRQLSDFSAARDRRKDGEYKDAFDIIVSYATDHGDDIPSLLRDTMTYAIDRGAMAVIDKIVSHPEYLNVADRETQLKAALSFVASSSFRGFNPVAYEQYEALAGRLLDMGADPQAGLEAGAPAGSVSVVTAALERGADPRRNGREAIKRAFTAEVAQLVWAAEGKLDREDFAALSSGDLTVARLRATDETTGRSGLMTAAAAGQLGPALKTFEREGAALMPADLLARDKGGDTALALICDRAQAGLLTDRNLWLLREQEYLEVFHAMPSATQGALGPRHDETLSGLKSHRDTVRLRQQAEEHRKRFRPK